MNKKEIIEKLGETTREVNQQAEDSEMSIDEVLQENSRLKEENQQLKKYIPLRELGLSYNTVVALESARVRVVGDVLKKSGNIYRIRNVGSTIAKEIFAKMQELGFSDFKIK